MSQPLQPKLATSTLYVTLNIELYTVCTQYTVFAVCYLDVKSIDSKGPATQADTHTANYCLWVL